MFEIVNPIYVGGGVALVMFFAILVALHVGRRLGKRSIARHGGEGTSTIGSLETAVFALLGLLIAFTFSGALQRFDTRRAQAVDEANAATTAWQRIDLLPTAAQPAVRDAFRKYLDARIETYRKLPDIKASRQEVARSQVLQSELWKTAAAAATRPDTPLGAQMLLVQALGQCFDLSTVRLTATQIHPPTVIYVMLIGLAIASALLAGYQAAGERKPDLLHRIAFAAIVAFTVYVILEIEYPRMGGVRIDDIDAVLANARAAMN
jgi:hypothetical protein